MGTTIFAVVLFGYLIVRRVEAILGLGDKSDALNPPDHIFSISSRDEYRTKDLADVAERSQQQGQRVVILCSPETETRVEEWTTQGSDIVTHRSLYRTVRLRHFPNHVIRSIQTTRELRDSLDISSWSLTIRGFNFVPSNGATAEADD